MSRVSRRGLFGLSAGAAAVIAAVPAKTQEIARYVPDAGDLKVRLPSDYATIKVHLPETPPKILAAAEKLVPGSWGPHRRVYVIGAEWQRGVDFALTAWRWRLKGSLASLVDATAPFAEVAGWRLLSVYDIGHDEIRVRIDVWGSR